ncbi:adenylosuccinate lyase [Desulfoplanes formicivorans]|uniref:Adenylosuccinate lyase n=1 Tax=Desulfoplanes formicivorans TaxID=1592317 RepID=A0A194AIG5_9BACT|nr:adenylosuccinate lyase [Desulfoplanes formicivorans]GAU08549.1 adenylosuccinate lyase [Desulfoplanes formicivorans]
MIERYSRQEMASLWTLENKFRVWLEVELAICEAWTRLGRIPQQEMQVIRDKADFDVNRILELEQITKHDVIAFLTAVEEKVGPASRFIHLGCTSSDIVDTANGILLVRAGEQIARDLDMILATLKKKAMDNKGRMVMGRTHGIHAEPTSFGLKMAGFYAEFKRHQKRWKAALENIQVGKISGAVGTYAQLDPQVEAIACDLLGLHVDPVSTQIIQRDRYAQYFTSLALIAGGIERLCIELRHLQRTEVLEVEEGFSKGQKGSSAMPHKKNPISAENLCGLARLVRSNSVSAMENTGLWHERDISHSSVERVIMPDSTILIDYMLHRLNTLVTNLRIIPENMERNLHGSFDIYFSQRVLLALVDAGLERQKGYEMVQKLAMHCWQNKISFPQTVRNDPAMKELLSAEVMDRVFDPSYYLRHEDMIFSRVFDASSH